MPLDGSSSDTNDKPNLAQHGSRSYAPLQSREQPAMRRPQFQHEFTTESFNNTAIGSPSPARPFAINTGRIGASTRGGGLSAAFHRVSEQNKNNVNKEEPVMDSRRPDRPLYQPVFSRQHIKDSSPSRPKVVSSRSTTRTPSPPKVKTQDILLSPASEVSEASPPREFAEAYKQINDAELLAALDEDMEATDEREAILPEDNARLLNVDPVLLPKNPRRGLSGADDAILLDSPEVHATQDSIPSLPSDLELENTAATSKVMSQRERNLQRLNATLGEAKAFSKARRKSKLGTNELRGEDGLYPGSHSGSSNTSGSILSDGSLNIPSAWGRKARQGKTWLSRVNRDMSGNENQPPAMDNLLQESEKSQAIQNWQAEASMTPLPEASQADLLEHNPSPASKDLPVISARDRVRQLAFGATGQSFPQNSQVQYENPVLNTTKRQETQSSTYLASQPNGYFTFGDGGKWEQIQEKAVTFKADDGFISSANFDDMLPSQRRSSSEALHSLDEKPNLSRARNSLNHDIFANNINAQQDNEDSGQLPQPVAPRYDLDHNKNQQDDHLLNRFNKIKAEVQIEPDTMVHTPAQVKPQTYLKTPLVTGAWIDTPLPVIKTEDIKEEPKVYESKESVRETLKKLDLEHLATTSQIIRDADTKQQTLQETAPRLPGSALAAIINRAKDKKAQGVSSQNEDTLLLDDSTILSLEELLANAEESDSSASDAAVKSAGSRVKTKHRIPSTRLPVEESDSEDDIGITTRLDRLKTSIHDAKIGVGSLQRKINNLPNKPSSTSSSRSQSRSRAHSDCEEAGEFHDFIWPCEKCGHRAGSPAWNTDGGSLLKWQWRPLQIYMPQLWFWPVGASIPRLTKLGWFSIVFWLLIVTEIILCDIYSPPFYATKMQGYGVDIHAPRPPFILPQLLWRHVLSSPLDMFQILLHTMIRIFTGTVSSLPDLFPATDDLLHSASSNMKWSYKPGIISNDQTDPLGMDGDEFI